MSLNLFLGLHNRVIQVLKDYLPAALDAIDTEQATGDVTPDVQSEDYYEWPKEVRSAFPSVGVRFTEARPVDDESNTFVGRMDALYPGRIVIDHGIDSAVTLPQKLQMFVFRYVAGVVRVLKAQNGLETIADPTRYVQTIFVDEQGIVVGDVTGQEGLSVLTAVIPVLVRRTEA